MPVDAEGLLDLDGIEPVSARLLCRQSQQLEEGLRQLLQQLAEERIGFHTNELARAIGKSNEERKKGRESNEKQTNDHLRPDASRSNA